MAESHRQHRTSAGFAMTSARTNGHTTTCRSRLRPQPGYTARTVLVRRWKAPMFWKTGFAPRSFSFLRPSRVVVPCWETRTPSRPRALRGSTAAFARSAVRLGVAQHGACRPPAHRQRAPIDVAGVSSKRLLERLAATLAGDQDAAVSDRPRDRAADPRLASERRKSIPHRPFERERQLITTTPSLDVNQLNAFEAAERNRPRPSSLTGATRERDHRDRRTATLELLPHSIATRRLAAPRAQPRRMRPGSHTTGRRAAQLARQRLAGRARSLSPATRDVEGLRRTRAPPRRIPTFSAPSARRRPTVRAPLIQPCTAVAHGRSPAIAPRPWSPFWSPFFWRELTFDGSRRQDPQLPSSANPLLPAQSDSL